MKYTQKALIVVSETGGECGNLPMIHDVFLSKMDAEYELKMINERLPEKFRKNIEILPISFEFEICQEKKNEK